MIYLTEKLTRRLLELILERQNIFFNLLDNFDKLIIGLASWIV